MHQRLKASQQRHEQRDAFLATQRCERLGQRPGQEQCVARAAEGLDRRSLPVGGELEGGRRAGQASAPVAELRLQALAGQLLPLPDRVVRVLDRQRRQGRRRPAAERGVEIGQLPEQHAHRPAVRGDVVRGQEQRILGLAQPEQRGPQHQVTRQIEGATRLLVEQTPQRRRPLRGRARRQVDHRHVHGPRRADALHRNAVHGGEGGPQRLVTRHDRIERLAQGLHLEGDVPARDRRRLGGAFREQAPLE